MNDLFCTCPVKRLPMTHADGCPMITGVPAESRHFEDVPVELTMERIEPPLARTLRARAEDRKPVTIHLLDRSVIPGVVAGVAEDGMTAILDSGGDTFEVDVSMVCVVQTRHRKE